MTASTATLAEIDTLLVSVGGGGQGKRWFEILTGERFAGDLRKQVTALLADEDRRRQIVDSLGPEGQVFLALLVEATAAATEVVLHTEAIKLLGAAGANRGLNAVISRGLLFRPGVPSPYQGNDHPRMWLPVILSRWLAPELRGLLTASAPVLDVPATEPDGPATDPSAGDLLVLAALATVRPRITGDRLYKKDAERVAAVLGHEPSAGTDATLTWLRARTLVRVDRDDTAWRLRPRWNRIEAWARLAPGVRTREALAAHRRGTGWDRLVAASGGFVPEDEVERAFRLGTPVYGWALRGGGPGAILQALDRQWQERRAAMSSWSEVECVELGGRRLWRLRPALAAALLGRVAPTAKVHVQSNFEILAPRETAPADLVMLCRAAELRRADVVATFVLTPASIQRAVLEGLAVKDIVARLSAMAAHDLPESVRRSAYDWAADAGRVILRSVVLLQFDDAGLADRAVPVLGKLCERVGPVAFAASDADLAEVNRRLRLAGMSPRQTDDDDRSHDGFDDYDHDHDHDDDDILAVAASAPSLPLASLGLAQPPTRIDALRRVRQDAARAEPVAPRLEIPSPRRPPTMVTHEGIAVVIHQAMLMDAALAVTLAGNRPAVQVRPFELSGAGGRDVHAIMPGGQEVVLAMAEITSATLLPETARRLGHNQPCPCGSGRKWKSCCAPDSRLLDTQENPAFRGG